MKTQRIRIHFSKTKAMQYTGHLDLRRAWVRTFRRAHLALSYSQGYTPRPQLNLAAPLPLGFLSTGEIGDFWLEDHYPLNTIQKSLQDALPPGLRINHLKEISDIHGGKLPNLVRSALYHVSFFSEVSDLDQHLQDILHQEQIKRERKGKSYDLRPLIYSLEVIPPDGEAKQLVEMHLSHLPGATGRPDEVIRELGLDPNHTQICRKKIMLES
ncbi:MAG: TIGR03936 family radical SAM-associated protein [Anaerolineales bacterium]|nr:TIGR03936 family radical SAM-associated protein [Anaerolineales bacterium]MBS3753940.1 TIGR03936 family radical SAM-associated protein [Anaerolineales bacterium]